MVYLSIFGVNPKKLIPFIYNLGVEFLVIFGCFHPSIFGVNPKKWIFLTIRGLKFWLIFEISFFCWIGEILGDLGNGFFWRVNFK